MKEFIIFTEKAVKLFQAANHPNDLLKNEAFLHELRTWYNRIFAEEPTVRGCGVCLYEKFREMKDLTDETIKNRLDLSHVIKQNTVIWHGSRPYSRKSPHLTVKIMSEIAKKHPEKVEENPYFEKKEPVKRKTAPKKKVENGNNSESKATEDGSDS